MDGNTLWDRDSTQHAWSSKGTVPRRRIRRPQHRLHERGFGLSTGIIAYADTLLQNGRLSWIDRRGNMLVSTGPPEGDYIDFRLSPDEKRLAVSLVDPKTNIVEIWLTDLARSSSPRVSSGGP